MLIRLILLLVLIGGGMWFYRQMRGEPLLRVPAAWSQAAQRDPAVREALKIRQSMARLLLEGRATGAADLLADVDGVLRRMVEMADLSRHLRHEAREVGAAALAKVQPSLDTLAADQLMATNWLRDAHGVLLQSAADEVEGTVGRLHEKLRAQADELNSTVAARREVNDVARKVRS